MCVVSQVMDYGRDAYPGLIPPAQPMPWFTPAVPTPAVHPDPADLIKQLDLGGVKKKAENEGRLPTKEEIEAFLKLVKAAEEFDKRANQPHCEDPEKIKFLHAIEQRLADLERKVDEIAVVVVPAGDAEPISLNGSSFLAANFTIGDQAYTLGDIVRIAHQESGLTANEWNEMAPSAREQRLLNTLVNLRAQYEA